MWKRGDVVVARYEAALLGDSRFASAWPLWVIEQTPSQLVGYLASGTEMISSLLTDGRALRDVPLAERWAHPRQNVRRSWERSDVVMIFPFAARHSLWVFHEAERHTGWYVNLEEPHRFGDRTITTRDGILDVWVPAETEQPSWKDEDEFEVAVNVGRLTTGEAAELRAEGERVIAERPWPTGWENWRPPDDWERPTLPTDWETDP
jgi:hypothetical protein